MGSSRFSRGSENRAPSAVLRTAAKRGLLLVLVRLDDPDVAILHLPTVALQVQRPTFGRLGPTAARWALLQLVIIVNLDAVMPDRHARVRELLLAVRIETGGCEIDVVGLPLQRWIAHVDQRRGLAVNPAALVVRALQAETVEHLHLVTMLRIDAAVAAALAGRKRHEREAELQMEFVILEFALAVDLAAEQVAIDDLAVDPFAGILAAEEDDGARRRLLTCGFALASHLVQIELLAGRTLDAHQAASDHGAPLPIFARNHNLIALGFGGALRAFGIVAALAAQAARQQVDHKLPVTPSDDLGAELDLVDSAGEGG